MSMPIDTESVLVSTQIDMNDKRLYTMTTRAEAVAATRQRILTACLDLHGQRLMADISLDDIAERAGVSVQTVLRHFGSRPLLVEATFEFAQTQVSDERRAPVGDVRSAVRVIVEHYERRGDAALIMLAQEGEGFMRRVTTRGKAMHRTWVESVFAPYLARTSDATALTDLLVVATDVYAWKLLRRDRGLSRARTEERLHTLVSALLAHHEKDPA
jgi:AcrR family transcriptional regulator